MCGLTESLVELLHENNSFVVRMTIVVLRYLFLNHGGPIQTPIALQLAEALLPLFDSVRICAPGHGHRVGPRQLVPWEFKHWCPGGPEGILRVFFLPFTQDDSQVQLSSMTAFQEMMDLLKKKQRKALKPHVRQSLFPLALHCHDDNPHVAEVRTRGLQVSPQAGAQLPPALVPPGLQPPPGHGTRTRLLCPGLWGHLCISAALQASREALHYSARLLKRKDIEQMLQVDKTWRFAKGLVRTAWKCQAHSGEAP